MNYLINAFCALVFVAGGTFGVYKAYKFVRNEVIAQTQKGLPSLEKFSRALTRR